MPEVEDLRRVAESLNRLRLKQTFRPKDAMEREFLERLIEESGR